MNPCRNPDVKSTLLPDGHVVLFSSKTEWAHTINPFGAIVWEFCDGKHSVDEIVAAVREVIKPEQQDNLSNQVTNFVTELLQTGLLEPIIGQDVE